ncbi:acetate--CoA ligase [Patescibacteria group bacterium]|nr:acetate--CoA ligase [Patescibacteria group bacterium]
MLETTEVLLKSKEIYKPSKKTLAELSKEIRDYKKTLAKANKNPLKFWEQAAEELDWYKKWDKVLDDSKKPFYKWFTGAKTNIVLNALDRHIGTEVENKIAIISEQENGKKRTLTYKQLNNQVCKFANALKKLGVKKHDRVAIYMPNIPEIAISMLACAKIGAMHSVVYAGFSAGALNNRIRDAKAKILITADGSYRRGKFINLKKISDDAVKLGFKTQPNTIKKVIVVKNTTEKINFNKKRDLYFFDLIKNESSLCATEKMNSEDPVFVLYTSGTTSKPKGVIHVHGGYQVSIARTLSWVFNIKDDDIYWCTADPGWITGHSYIVYAPLILGSTTIMFDGVPDYPRKDRIWSMIEKYKVTKFYTAPTLIRAMMRYGDTPVKKHNLKSLKILGSVGEPINPEAWKWYYKVVGGKRCPIMDTWWQTETGAFMITPLPSYALKPGSATYAFPGIKVDVFDKKGKPVKPGKGGYLVIKTPWPSMIRTIFNNPKRYIKTYWSQYKKYYFTGDIATKDKDGYIWVQGRCDDVLKIAGHRIGTAEIESALVAHKSVAEAAVIGVPDEIKGEVAKCFVILKKNVSARGGKAFEKLQDDLKMQVRKELGPIAVIKEIEFVEKLPKTRSGKIMRRVLKAKELGQDLGDTSTLVD